MYKLPLNVDLNQIEILKALSDANNKIGELKGMIRLLPNPRILLNAITLGEAKDSSEIENIITTYDELYKEMTSDLINSRAAKEVISYRTAINMGFEDIKEKGYINVNVIEKIHRCIEANKGGIRRLPGTVIKNTTTGEVLHMPPQSETEIMDYMGNLESYINSEFDEYDPLIKMAIIHYQFESIHPFYDGNGRTGRILNVLYLVMKEKIDIPILYLSRYIIRNKESYYELLKSVQEDEKNIVNFVVYLLKGIEETSIFTINFIEEINSSIERTRELMVEKLPKIYSKELLDLIYFEFYTKNEFIQKGLGVTRTTATKYLKELEKQGFLISEKVGKEVIYKNVALFELMEKW